MALVLFAVCLSFSFPALLGGEVQAEPSETVVIVPEVDSGGSIEDTVLEYAKVSAEVHRQESMGRDVKVVDPGMPDSEPERKVVEKMKEIIGNDRFVPGDRHEEPARDQPGDMREHPEKKEMEPPSERPAEQVRDTADVQPDSGFVEEIADYMDSTGDAKLADASRVLRSIPWSILIDFNESFVAVTSLPSERKDGVDDSDEEDADICIEEREEEPVPGYMPDEFPPEPVEDVAYDAGIPQFYYTGVTTSGQTS